MTGTAELSHLIGVLRGQRLAIGVDDVTRIATVLHHTRGWPRERRVRALKTLLGRSAAERERFDHIAPLLLAPGSGIGATPPPAAHGEPGAQEPPGPLAPSIAPRPRWPVVAGGAAFLAALALALYAAWPPGGPRASIDAGSGSAPPAHDAGIDGPVGPPAAGETRRVVVPEPSSLPGTLRGAAEAAGVASLLLIAWSVLALRPRRRRDAAIDRLARSSGRRVVGLTADRATVHPIDRRTIATLAHMLAAPAPSERETALDPGETVEETARNAGRLTLCFARVHEQPALLLLEDVSRSMERWPAHATQLVRALEAQGQAVERRFIAGDPLQIFARRSLDGRAVRFEDAAAGARVAIVSDGAYFDHAAARTARHARALDGALWLQPRPAELWRSGARWLNGHAFARTLGTVPSSLVVPIAATPPWRPPRPRTDVDEIADAWRSALTEDAYFAFAATALLDLAASCNATLVWTLISDGVIAPPWRQFERLWDLPELAVLPGGRISLAPELRDRLLADARSERPELLHRVASWIDSRLAAAVEAAGDSSLGAAVGEVYRDRVARASGLDGSGARVRRLEQQGLSSLVAARVDRDERRTWRIRDPHTAVTARLRGPLLGLALITMVGAGVASAVVPAQHDVSRIVVIDAGAIDAASDGPADAPDDAYPGDAGRGERVAQRTGCVGCHLGGGKSRVRTAPPFAGMWGATVELADDRSERPVRRTVDERYVRDKLLYPGATLHRGYPPVHVSYADSLGEGDIADLIAYIQSLARPRPAALDDGGVPDDESAPDVAISGVRTIERDTVIRGWRVTIAGGAKIRVRHGVMLRIEGDEIVVAGPAEIDGTGDDGAPGADAVARGEYLARDRVSFGLAKRRCQRNRPDGGPGRDGGPGATIALQARTIRDDGLTVRVAGGAGGRGGHGAPGLSVAWVDESPGSPKPAHDGGTIQQDQQRPDANDAPKGKSAPSGSDEDLDVPAPAPASHTPRPDRASRDVLPPSRKVAPPAPLRRRDTYKCPDGTDGPPGNAGARGSFSKSSPGDPKASKN
jgi:cytochrome c553